MNGSDNFCILNKSELSNKFNIEKFQGNKNYETNGQDIDFEKSLNPNNIISNNNNNNNRNYNNNIYFDNNNYINNNNYIGNNNYIANDMNNSQNMNKNYIITIRGDIFYYSNKKRNNVSISYFN